MRFIIYLCIKIKKQSYNEKDIYVIIYSDRDK